MYDLIKFFLVFFINLDYYCVYKMIYVGSYVEFSIIDIDFLWFLIYESFYDKEIMDLVIEIYV